MAAIPSVATCAAAICNGRLTSTPAGRNAPIAVITKRCSEGVKSALCGPKIGSMNGREARGSHQLKRRLRRVRPSLVGCEKGDSSLGGSPALIPKHPANLSVKSLCFNERDQYPYCCTRNWRAG